MLGGMGAVSVMLRLPLGGSVLPCRAALKLRPGWREPKSTPRVKPVSGDELWLVTTASRAGSWLSGGTVRVARPWEEVSQGEAPKERVSAGTTSHASCAELAPARGGRGDGCRSAKVGAVDKPACMHQRRERQPPPTLTQALRLACVRRVLAVRRILSHRAVDRWHRVARVEGAGGVQRRHKRQPAACARGQGRATGGRAAWVSARRRQVAAGH